MDNKLIFENIPIEMQEYISNNILTFRNAPITIKAESMLDNTKQMAHWAIGNTITIHLSRDDINIELSAPSYNQMSLHDKSNNRELARIKGTDPTLFQGDFGQYIKNDAELIKILDRKHPDYLINTIDSKWWEARITSSKTDNVVDGLEATYEKISDVIVEMIEEDFDNLLDYEFN